MLKDVQIVPLADFPEAIAPMAELFASEWGPYYGADGPGDAVADLHESCNRGRLPLALLAIDASGGAIGTAALKEQSIGSDVAPGPWLAGFLVHPDFRRQGVGSALVAAIEREAARIGLKAIFISTDAGETIVKQRGWMRVGASQSLRGEVAVYRCDIAPDAA